MQNLPFRPNVCLLIMNDERRLFLGERHNESDKWQFPQGGVEENMSLEENAIREAHEELGVDIELLKIVKKFKTTHKYDFTKIPDYAVGVWRGQDQTFWLLEFLGADKDINLSRFHPEFSKYRWCTSEEVRKIAEQKRLPGYLPVLEEFELYLSSLK